ncbi:MAG: DUF3467 domain-containing protein [Phycisphaerae bacterium]
MSNQPDSPGNGNAEQPPQGPSSQPLKYDPIGARVPDHVAAGVFSTGVIVMDGQEEFVVDFIQGIAKPLRVAARVVLGPQVMSQFIEALKKNLAKYEQAFGKPPELPRSNTDRRPSPKEVYKGLKLPEEVFSGAYANTVRIAHSPAEFHLDFITRFFPTAAVSARVYMAAPQVPRLIESLSASFQNFLKKKQNPPDTT